MSSVDFDTQGKLDSAYRRILRYALGAHFPVCISNAELARRTGATALSKTLRQRRLRLVVHALRMANPSPLTILLRFLQAGHRRRRGHARTLMLHQNIIDDISAINQSVKYITSASSSYFNRIVATLGTNWAFNIYNLKLKSLATCHVVFHTALHSIHVFNKTDLTLADRMTERYYHSSAVDLYSRKIMANTSRTIQQLHNSRIAFIT